MSNSKYVIAGTILAGVGIVYANHKGLTYEKVQNYVEENKDKFQDFLMDLMELSLEILGIIMEYVKKIITNLIFKGKMKFY